MSSTTSPAHTPPTSLEDRVVALSIGSLGLIAFAYDLFGLGYAWQSGSLIAVGRGISAMALGWICGWYFTVKFPPTNSILLQGLFSLSGHVVAVITAICAASLMLVLDVVGADPHKATFFGITAVTFAPVAAWFATQLDEERSVHIVSGFGIGALTYIVVLGVPS